jgi:hypothetical protein
MLHYCNILVAVLNGETIRWSQLLSQQCFVECQPTLQIWYLYFGVWSYDRWLQLLKNIFKICRHGDTQKAFLVGRSKYLPASPLVDLIVSCKSREFADSHYNLVNCFSSNTFERRIRVFFREAYFVKHSTKLRLYVVKNLCQLDTALEALWSRLKWLRLIWEPQLTLIENHRWKLCTVKFLEIFEGINFWCYLTILIQNMSKILSVHSPTCLYHERSDYFRAHMVQLSIDFCTSCFWYDILFFGREFKLVYVNSALPKQDAMVCTDGPRRYIFVSAYRFQLFHDWNLFTNCVYATENSLQDL